MEEPNSEFSKKYFSDVNLSKIVHLYMGSSVSRNTEQFYSQFFASCFSKFFFQFICNWVFLLYRIRLILAFTQKYRRTCVSSYHHKIWKQNHKKHEQNGFPVYSRKKGTYKYSHSGNKMISWKLKSKTGRICLLKIVVHRQTGFERMWDHLKLELLNIIHVWIMLRNNISKKEYFLEFPLPTPQFNH